MEPRFLAFLVLSPVFVIAGIYVIRRYRASHNTAATTWRERYLSLAIMIGGQMLAANLSVLSSWTWRMVYEVPLLVLLDVIVLIPYLFGMIWLMEWGIR
jgi:hypothetical protein